MKTTTGLLLYGPPGCSKTMTAKAIATESGLNFIAVKGAQFLNMYVGETERAIRELFARARTVSPSIIFFDEIDAIGASPVGGQHTGVHTVTTLLNELDGVDEAKGFFVLAATNRPEVLDPALLRPGRLDNMIYVGPPDRDARQYILEKRSRQIKHLAEDVDFVHLADKSEGRSGAEMADICHRAGELGLESWIKTGEKQKVGQKHFLRAMEEVQRNITPEMERRYEAFAAERQMRKQGEKPVEGGFQALEGKNQIGRQGEELVQRPNDGDGGVMEIIVRSIVDLGANLARAKIR